MKNGSIKDLTMRITRSEKSAIDSRIYTKKLELRGMVS